MGQTILRFLLIAATLLTISCTPAVSQDVGQMLRMFGNMASSMSAQAARRDWYAIDTQQLKCLDQKLKERGATLSMLVERGVSPTEPQIMQLRRSCGSAPAQVAVAPSVAAKYSVSGLELNAQLPASIDSEYRCSPSNQYPGLQWCEKRSLSPTGIDSRSLLQTTDGRAVYLNRYVQPATFKPGEIDGEIARLSKKFVQQATLLKSPSNLSNVAGVIAAWGDVKLELIEEALRVDLAADHASKTGILIDFLGDFTQSAKLNMPVYRVSGGPGFVWSASHDNSGKGALRYFASDFSFAPQSQDRSKISDGASNGQSPPARAPYQTLPGRTQAARIDERPLLDAANLQDRKSKIVKVKGYGPSEVEAKQDAIRTALQQTMQQLIVVDRVIKDDQLIRDKIMSTMNGYIENFKQLSTSREGESTVIEAEVTVSPSKITNFVASNGAASATVDGGSLFAESQREVEQRRIKGEIFDKLFDGFPSSVLKARVVSIAPSEKDPSDSAMKIEIAFSDEWLRSLTSGLQELSVKMIPTSGRYGSRSCSDHGNCFTNDEMEVSAVLSVLPEARAVNGRSKSIPYACIFRTPSGTCFILPAGQYGASFKYNLRTPILFLALQFVDDAGQSALQNNRTCLVRPLKDVWVKFDQTRGQLILETSPRVFEVLIKSNELQTDRAKKAIVYPFFESSGSTGLVESVVMNSNGIKAAVINVRSPQVADICAEATVSADSQTPKVN